MSDELRKHLSEALAANTGVGLSDDELDAVVKHLQKGEDKSKSESKEKK